MCDDKEIEFERQAHSKCAGRTEVVDEIILKITSLENNLEDSSIFKELDHEGDKLEWPNDRDYVAVALQYYFNKSKSVQIKVRMLKHAITRARWCASCATSGSEGLSRSRHISELEKELASIMPNNAV